jgi:hypothetical protein
MSISCILPLTSDCTHIVFQGRRHRAVGVVELELESRESLLAGVCLAQQPAQRLGQARCDENVRITDLACSIGCSGTLQRLSPIALIANGLSSTHLVRLVVEEHCVTC